MSGRPSDADEQPRAELERLRAELEQLRRDNAELRARAIFDEQLDSDAARYEVIVANLAEGVVLQGADGSILSCNAAAERILGLSVEQMSGRSSLDPRWRSIHEDGSPFPGETHPAMVSLRTGRALHDVVMGVHKPDGGLTWISIDSQPLFKPGEDRPYAVVASFADISSHKQAEARARDSENKLRFALRAARMITWDWDLNSGAVHCSEDVAGLLGLETGGPVPTFEDYVALVHPEDRREFEAAIQRAIASDEDGDDFILEHRVVHRDGTARWVGNFGRVIRDERGEPTGLAGTVTDISVRKSLEDQLMLSQRMETVGRLAGGVAHDFNNLLTAILGCAELAGSSPDLAPAVRDALETICEASEKAARLTRQLLSFARKQVFNLEVFDLRALVLDTERLLSRIIGEDIRIETRLGHAEVPVRADRAQIEQILINLAVNARDAMPGGGELTIELGVRTIDPNVSAALAAGTYALLELRDCGQGIPAAVLPRIFDPFFTTKAHGTGLGLSTCYGIVKQLGGEILVESQPGKGTRFSIYLPLTRERVEDLRERALPRPVAGRGRILLAEDDAMVRLIAERGLRAHGYEVFTAADGAEALALFERRGGEIDLLLSDVVMPNMTGYELAERLQRQKPGLEVVFVSGYADEALGREGARAAAVEAVHVAKPYTISQIAELIGRLLVEQG